MTPDKIAKLKALAEAATQGEWSIEPHGGLPTLYSGRCRDIFKARHGLNLMQFSEGDSNMEANLAHIAAANPATILTLLSHITRIEAERDVAHNAGYVSGFEQAELHFGGSIDAAFNDGVEAAAMYLFNEFEDSEGSAQIRTLKRHA